MSWTTSVTHTGEFVRKQSVFRDFISSEPDARFPPAANRYHLYVSLACPWAHRTLIMKSLKGLDHVIAHTVVDWFLDKETGWTFTSAKDGCQADPIHGFSRLREMYELAGGKDYGGNITVPVLFDKELDTIVNNESSEIIRMLNSEFNAHCATPEQAQLDFYPQPLRAHIDDTNGWMYSGINNGVYRSGFAKSQAAYDKAVTEVFDSLDRVEAILSSQRYICADEMTEADIRLFTTLIRFDLVYHGHFKCNVRKLSEYPNVSGHSTHHTPHTSTQTHTCHLTSPAQPFAVPTPPLTVRARVQTFHYMLELYQMPHILPTVDLHHCKAHYYASHLHINPTGIVPKGPMQNLDQPHGRDTRTYTTHNNKL